MKHVLSRLACAMLSVLLGSAIVQAQQATAQLSGRVADQSGAVLPGVTVTATQTETGFTRTVVTDADGLYVMPSLPTGPYRLEVMLQGFRPYSQTGIVLQVNANAVINTVLQVGELAETVTVEAATPLVDVRSAGISEVVENERIVELPLQGRNATDLVVLAGAAVQVGTASPQGARGSAISVAGGLSYGVAYTLDGAMHNEPNTNLNLPLPFPDALQEFSVATSGLSAESGVHAGASVNAVTKSGTNTIHGNLFEFLRDRRFNATSPFAMIGPDGKRRDDGLRRNQFGGTLGGPIVRDRLFFFGGYQGTLLRWTEPDRIAFVPTAAMLAAGDFTAIASPACNRGRQVTLRAPFVNNRIDPALFSRAAVFIASKLPAAEDECGTVTSAVPRDYDEGQAVAKIDYQWNANHTIFGRYIGTFRNDKPPYPRSGNILAQTPIGRDAMAHTVTFGDTLVFGANTVNSLRFAYNQHGNHTLPVPTFDTNDAGIKVYTYVPGSMALTVRGAFSTPGGHDTKARFDAQTYQIAEDLTTVRGRHQLSAGVNLAYWTSYQEINARSIGLFEFNGSVTGLSLSDFLTGRLARLEHSAPGIEELNQSYFAAYVSDAWRMTNRLTINAGLRWEPFFGSALNHGSISNFVLDNFRNGVRSTVYVNAPPGLIFPGDPGFHGKSGHDPQWGNLSPRVGIAWDVTGDGRLAVRSSYGLAYDFPTAVYQYISANAAPFGNRLRVDFPAGGFENPYRDVPGGDTHPVPVPPPRDIAFPFYGAYSSVDPSINSPRVQSWNVTVERQLGEAWQASASYLGSYADRLWGAVAINPGVFLGTDPCTLNGVFYRVCTTPGNLDQRRVLSLEHSEYGQYFGPVDRFSSVGTQDYHALKLSFRRRAATGLSLNGNYTWTYCVGNITPAGFDQISGGYQKPEAPAFDRGNCESRRDHIANFTVGYQTPQLTTAGLRVLASDWRLSGIVNARSGAWLSVTQSINRASATTGIQGRSGQPVDKVLDNPYGAKTVNNYLNPAAFALPVLGTLGSAGFFSVEGPGFWTVDVALSRLLPLGAARSLELRIEAFNLFNNFNWGNPVTVLDQPTFGRILTAAGDPRILQLGVKYAF